MDEQRPNPGRPLDASANGSAAGLPGASPEADDRLLHAGIDPDRLSITPLGLPAQVRRDPYPPWVRRMSFGIAVWIAQVLIDRALSVIPVWIDTALTLIAGLLILQAACDALITATERLAARKRWPHYIAGTVVEICSTLPELVAIAFIVPVSPVTAYVIALITIYNNALVFSVYSYLLPKDQRGRFLMPEPITEAGTRILIAGAALGLTLGLVLLALRTHDHPKTTFAPVDFLTLGVLLLIIFAVYVRVLLANYAEEEDKVHDTLALDAAGIERRRTLVYSNVQQSPWRTIAGMFAIGVLGAFLGGERVGHFAAASIGDLGLNSVLTALILAGFAGMSEYVILWRSHRKQEYGIALANAFGGITQVMYLVFPFTLICIGIYQAWLTPGHPELPIALSLTNILLLIFLAPTFFVLGELIEDDHTLSILDATIMTVIFLLLIILLVTYGAAPLLR